MHVQRNGVAVINASYSILLRTQAPQSAHALYSLLCGGQEAIIYVQIVAGTQSKKAQHA